MPLDNKILKQLADKGRRAKWWLRRGGPRSGFKYSTYDGTPITDPDALARIASLVIPPAWRHVRICPAAKGKIQAVGIDGSGRLQYIYHPDFARRQQKKKFARIERLGGHLPRLRRVTNKHIALEGFGREKVLAIMTRLINDLYIRIGTDKSVKKFRTFGITTLGKRHVEIRRGGRVTFDFVGKSRIKHRLVLVDEELARLLASLISLGGGRKLFQYIGDDGRLRPVKPAEINAYIKQLTADEFTAKDLRTWGASMTAAIEFARVGPAGDEKQLKANVVKVVERVATRLGNTPAVCRSSYIHPGVMTAYAAGVTIDGNAVDDSRRARRIEANSTAGERALLELFEKFA